MPRSRAKSLVIAFLFAHQREAKGSGEVRKEVESEVRKEAQSEVVKEAQSEVRKEVESEGR